MKSLRILYTLGLLLFFFSCTKLEEDFRSELEENNNSGITADQLLRSAYQSISGTFVSNGNMWSSQEISTDEAIAPTRGGDWDDNGNWRALSSHTWNDNQEQIRNAYNDLLSAQFAASNVLQFNPTPQQAAEARFIRAFTMFWVLDAYDQIPYREDFTDFKKLPRTLKGVEAADFIIGELNAILADLPDTGPAYVANKNGARALLMKVYLNKGVYANRAAPAFDAADMTQVSSLADQITAANRYSLANIFFDNFAPDNNVKSTENIYTFENNPAANRGGDIRGFAFMVSHYNMNPGGWNGFSTLSDFYDKFEAADQRRGMYYVYPGSLPNPGKRINAGFLFGQQYNLTTDAPLADRQGAPLAFTREVKLRETGSNLEVTGIRVIKYPFDYATPGDQKNNDFAVFRYADVLLMKAEALLRSGNAAGALPLVNSVRAKRGVGNLASIDLDALLDERGRELYWEGYRRQDLIRFGKYLQAYQEKPASDAKTLLFPIPGSQLAVNTNLTQNPGY